MDKKLIFTVFILSFSIYLFTMVPSLTGDDSGELAGVGATLGIAHSPGYPIYSLVGKAITFLVPLGNNAYRINLVSALFIALSASILFILLFKISSNRTISVSFALVYAFSEIVWAMATVTEVYGISAFFAVLLTLSILRKPELKNMILIIYILSLGILAHYTIIFLIPGILWIAYLKYKDNLKENYKVYILYTLMFGVLGISAILFMYIRSKTEPLFDWEDPETLKRLYQVVARLRYGSVSLAQGGAPPLGGSVILSKIVFFFEVIKDNVTYIGLIIFFAGLYRAFKDKVNGWLYIILLISSGPGFLLLANVNIGPASAELLKRFLFLPFIFGVSIMAYAFRGVPKKYVYFVLLLPLFLVVKNLSALNRRNEFIFNDYAKNILRTLPQNAILFSDRADEMEFCVAYLLNVENRRPDITFVDCNAGVTKSIYGDDYYRIWGKPRLQIRERTEKGIIENTNRPVFYATFVPDMINIPRYQTGVVYGTRNFNPKLLRFPYLQTYSIRVPEKEAMSDMRVQSLTLSHFQILGNYYLKNRNYKEAELLYSSLMKYDDTNRASETLAYLYYTNKNYKMAEKYYKLALTAQKDSPGIYINLGTLYKSMGDSQKAEQYYKQALGIDPYSVQAHYNLGVLYWTENKWEMVVKAFENVLKLDPNHGEAKEYLPIARKNVSGNK